MIGIISRSSRHPTDVPFVHEFWWGTYDLGAISPRKTQILAIAAVKYTVHMYDVTHYVSQCYLQRGSTPSSCLYCSESPDTLQPVEYYFSTCFVYGLVFLHFYVHGLEFEYKISIVSFQEQCYNYVSIRSTSHNSLLWALDALLPLIHSLPHLCFFTFPFSLSYSLYLLSYFFPSLPFLLEYS